MSVSQVKAIRCAKERAGSGKQGMRIDCRRGRSTRSLRLPACLALAILAMLLAVASSYLE